eukprot:1185031-Prorocentrum_minimum.AAC.1
MIARVYVPIEPLLCRSFAVPQARPTARPLENSILPPNMYYKFRNFRLRTLQRKPGIPKDIPKGIFTDADKVPEMRTVR